MHEMEKYSEELENIVLPLLEIDRMQPDRYRYVNGKESEVACFPLESFPMAVNQTSGNYLSLDVCGNELPMLDYISVEKFNVTVRSACATFGNLLTLCQCVKCVSVGHFLRPRGAKKYKSYIHEETGLPAFALAHDGQVKCILANRFSLIITFSARRVPHEMTLR